MGNAVEKLQEPDLVTRFQRLCGLLPGRVDTCPRTVRAGVRGSGPLPGCIGGCGALRGANGCSCTNCAASQDLRSEYPLEFGVMVALLLCVLVSLSRLYTGMHSVLDVICGVVLTAVLLAISFPFWDTMDSLIIHSNLTPALALCGPFLLCIHYPEMNPWSTTRGDTTIIMGAWAGSTIASWLCYQFSLTQDVPKENLPFELPSITLGLIRNMMSRYLVGVSLVVITRQLSKTLVLSIVCQVMGVSPTDTEARKDLWVEVPYKFATYSIVGVSGFFGGPLLFHYIGLD